MGVAETVATGEGHGPRSRGAGCRGCGAAEGRLPEVHVTYPVHAGVRRCPECGSRRVSRPEGSSWLLTCEGCGLPFLAAELLPHGDRRCGTCRVDAVPMPLPDPALEAALEREVRAALGIRWSFATGEPLQGYLDRIARQVAERMEDGLAACRVAIVEADDWRALALPSGTLLVSAGLLFALEDEAELAFVLGHEAAHAASGEAAVRLARLGLFSDRPHDRPGGEAWAEAAEDLLRLGYGRRREREADRRALEAVLDVGYDPASATRFLERSRRRIQEGDPLVAAYAAAHPTPADRIRRIEFALHARPADRAALRVNREVFRRVLRHAAEAGGLRRTSLHDTADLAAGTPAPPSWKRALWLLGVTAGLTALAAALLRLLALLW